MPTPEVKEVFLVHTCIERLLRNHKVRKAHPIIHVDIYPLASMVGSTFAKKVAHTSWGDSMDQSDVKKETR